MGNIKQRVAALESSAGHSSLGALIDALDDDEAIARISISPELAAALNGLDDNDAAFPRDAARYGDMLL